MIKIRKIKFINHPILYNLSLNFCNRNGTCAETIIIAGENGVGKSTIVDSIYRIASRQPNCEAEVELEINGKVQNVNYYYRAESGQPRRIRAKDKSGHDMPINLPDYAKLYPLNGIFSDVDINFNSQVISSVTSLVLDASDGSRRSNSNLPQEIKQLIIDIQALDDAEIAKEYRAAKRTSADTNTITATERMPRFTKAFNYMFDCLTYKGIENKGNHKEILFEKNGIDIGIDGLSSGEKQIVYRGCFLLRDANAISGSIVIIDEPEISLHPSWQKKIMEFYQGIFTDGDGIQTSQIFAVTHSPFVIHSDNNINRKVIVLHRSEAGNIGVLDKPEYYSCNSISVIEDAFNIDDFQKDKPTVYLEGRTDEKYFNRALEVFGYDTYPYRFKWIGYLDENGKEVNSGASNLEKAIHVLITQNPTVKTVCLFDCDINKHESSHNNIYTRVIPYYKNAKGINKGIENALVLDAIDITQFYKTRDIVSDYGEKKSNQEFQKMDFCCKICAMEEGTLIKVFSNLKTVIDMINGL